MISTNVCFHEECQSVRAEMFAEGKAEEFFVLEYKCEYSKYDCGVI